MPRRSALPLATICLALAIAGGPPPAGAANEEPTAAIRAARATVDAMFRAFNAADNEAIAKLFNYPHALLVSAGDVTIAEGPDDVFTDFETIRREEDWQRSSLDELQITFASPDRVHCHLVFSRFDGNGRRYLTVPALWILTREDGHWGIQVRSVMMRPGTRSERLAAEREAKRGLDRFLAAWNSGDNEKLRQEIHTPFLTVVPGGPRIARNRDDFSTDFDRLRAAGWHHSTFDAFRVVRSSADQVHVEVDYSRYRADGTRYAGGTMLYVLTAAGGRFRMQLRAPVPRAQ